MFKTEFEVEVEVEGEYYWAIVGVEAEISYTPGKFEVDHPIEEDVRRIAIKAVRFVKFADSYEEAPDPITLVASIPSAQLFENVWDDWILAQLSAADAASDA